MVLKVLLKDNKSVINSQANMSRQKIERNRQIYKKNKKGKSTYALAREYDISQPAIFKIVKREERKIQYGNA